MGAATSSRSETPIPILEHTPGKHREQRCRPQDLARTIPGHGTVPPDPPALRPLDQVTDDRGEPSVDALARLCRIDDLVGPPHEFTGNSVTLGHKVVLDCLKPVPDAGKIGGVRHGVEGLKV